MKLLVLFIFPLISLASDNCVTSFNKGVHSRHAAHGYYTEAGVHYTKGEEEKNNTQKKRAFQEAVKFSKISIETFYQSTTTLTETLGVCPADTHTKINELISKNNQDIGIVTGFIQKIDDKLMTKDLQDVDK